MEVDSSGCCSWQVCSKVGLVGFHPYMFDLLHTCPVHLPPCSPHTPVFFFFFLLVNCTPVLSIYLPVLLPNSCTVACQLHICSVYLHAVLTHLYLYLPITHLSCLLTCFTHTPVSLLANYTPVLSIYRPALYAAVLLLTYYTPVLFTYLLHLDNCIVAVLLHA